MSGNVDDYVVTALEGVENVVSIYKSGCGGCFVNGSQVVCLECLFSHGPALSRLYCHSVAESDSVRVWLIDVNTLNPA